MQPTLAAEVGRPLGNQYFGELDEDSTEGMTEEELMALAGLVRASHNTIVTP